MSEGLVDWEQPLLAIAARIAIGLNLFKIIADENRPITSKELAHRSGGEELLIGTTFQPTSKT